MCERNFGQIIAAKRKEKHLSQPQLAELLNKEGLDVRHHSISKWEKNVNIPNVLQFFVLCEVLGIEDVNRTFQIGTRQIRYSQLNEEGQKKVLDYMDLLIKSSMYVREDSVPYVDSRRIIRIFELPVSAGTGQFLDSDCFSEIEVGNEVSKDADFGVRVSGDSMEPLYLNGQLIWVHEQPVLEEGNIGIFYLDGESYVKKYHQTETGIELISLNQKYAPVKAGPESSFRIFGKVVG